MVINIQNCGVSTDASNLLKGIAKATTITELTTMICNGDCGYFPQISFTVVLPHTTYTFSDKGIASDWKDLVEELAHTIDHAHNALPNDYVSIDVDIFKGKIAIHPFK